jgi:CTD small phosphatase-like protein 2
LKENNNELIIKKIKDYNIKKYERNIDILNHIKNWSRNISKMNININKRKNVSSNDYSDKINKNKLSSINHNIEKKKHRYNLTINDSFKDNKKEKIKNKQFNSGFIKYENIEKRNNDNLINSNIINRNIFNSIGNINKLNDNNNNDKKLVNNRYINYLSHYNTFNLIKQNKKFGLSTINILSNKLSNDKINNHNHINFILDKNNKNKDDENLYNIRDYIINDNSNKIEELEETEKINKRNKRKYYISQNSKKIDKNILKINNMNNIKYKLIVPGLTNTSKNKFKDHIFKSLENNKVLNDCNNNNESLIKDLNYLENLNNINNFIIILNQHILIENVLNNIFNSNSDNYNIEMIKSLINKYNIFFNKLNDICFELNIFVYKEYNNLLQEIIKLLICFHCLIFIILSLYDINSSLNIIKINYMYIFNKLSFCIYNFFFKFIYIDLKNNNKYNNLSFVETLYDIYSNNSKYQIKSSLSNNDIFSILKKNYFIIKDSFNKILNNNNNFMNEIFLSFKSLLLNLNKKDLLYHIDICLNIYLYTLLEKNIQKAILNSSCSKNKYGLNSVPYLPPISDESKYKYTAVLDIDETLGHFISNEINHKYFSNYGYLILDNNNEDNEDILKVGIFLVRPFAKLFLEELYNLFYEIVIFTAGTKEYCDKILDILDINNNLIKYRLYRSHLSLRNKDDDVKDLSLLGRNLNKIIMIDNLPKNYKLQEDNGLPINSWTGDINDTSLKDLLIIMKYIAEKNVKDVRDIIRAIKTQFNNNDYNYSKIKLIN